LVWRGPKTTTELLGQKQPETAVAIVSQHPLPMLPPLFNLAKMEPPFASHSKATALDGHCEPVASFEFSD